VTRPGWVDDLNDLLGMASPAVLATYRRDGTVSVSPVWFRLQSNEVEVVIAEGDPKLRHLRLDPRCVLMIFETSIPFRGLKFDTTPEIRADVDNEARTAISTKYLGGERAATFVAGRQSPGMVLAFDLGDGSPWTQSDVFPPE